MDTLLWWIIGIVVAVLLAATLIPEFYGRSTRRREKQLSHRAKKRIQL